eukprot:365827_1
MALRAWLRKHEVFDRDLMLLFPKYNVNDPAKDLKNLKYEDWLSIQKQIKADRANLLKDKKAKARLEKKFSKINKIWRQKTKGKRKKNLKKKLNKMQKDPLLEGRRTYGKMSREWEREWKQQQNEIDIEIESKQAQTEEKETILSNEVEITNTQITNTESQTETVNNIQMQQNIVHGTLSDDEIEEYVTIKIKVKSLKYNKLKDTYSMTLDDCMISENNPLRQIVKIEIDSKHIDTNVSNDSNPLSLNEIDTVLDEIEMNENILKFDSKHIALNANDKLLICGFVRQIQESAVVPDDVIGVITVYIQS